MSSSLQNFTMRVYSIIPMGWFWIEHRILSKARKSYHAFFVMAKQATVLLLKKSVIH